MKKSKNYTLKVFNHGKEIDKVRTHSIRQLTPHLRSINWQKGTSTYLRVSYGKKIDGLTGKLSTFINDGYFNSEEDLSWALNAFKDEN